MRVAGHTFDSLDRCSCGRKWSDIRHVTDIYLGAPGIAHVGNLDCDEIVQIELERDRRARLFAQAMAEVGT